MDGMLAMRFGDTDVDEHGKINAAEFDGSCKDRASLPRRFGLAPSWEKEYGNGTSPEELVEFTAEEKDLLQSISGFRSAMTVGLTS